MFRALSALSLVLLVAACASTPTPQRLTPPSPTLQTTPPQGVYRIDPEQSEMRVLVYRAGPLANFGHNHVLVNRELSGTATIGSTLESSSFILSVPVARFTVDEARVRAEEGEDFTEEVPDSARMGTLHNMLAPTLLNADMHPTLDIRSEQVMETNGQLNAIMALQVAGHDASIEAPFVMSPAPTGFSVTAEFVVRQTELGLTPLSLMAGALQVRDSMHIKLKLRLVPP
jgi:hypothetical protein